MKEDIATNRAYESVSVGRMLYCHPKSAACKHLQLMNRVYEDRGDKEGKAMADKDEEKRKKEKAGRVKELGLASRRKLLENDVPTWENA